MASYIFQGHSLRPYILFARIYLLRDHGGWVFFYTEYISFRTLFIGNRQTGEHTCACVARRPNVSTDSPATPCCSQAIVRASS